MTTPTCAPPLDYRPRPLVVNKTPCRTRFFLFLILVGAAVLSVDRYLTNDALRRVEDIETWSTRETAQIIAAESAQARTVYALRTNEVLAGQVRLLQERLDGLTAESVKLLRENLILRSVFEEAADTAGACPFQGPLQGPVVTPPQLDKET
jgi:hypothetical protein